MNKQPKSVLIVDDEPFIRQSFIDYFEDHLWYPLESASGEQALELLSRYTPAAAIVDIRLGGMDGNTFIRKANTLCPEMIIILCTGSPEYEIPPDLQQLATVCKTVFRKPIIELNTLRKELEVMIASVRDFSRL